MNAIGTRVSCAAPDEHRLVFELAEAVPEAFGAARLVAGDVARGLVEGEAAGGGAEGAEELVEAGGDPALVAAGDDAADDRLDDRARRRLQQAEQGQGRPEDEVECPIAAQPRHRRAEQDDAVDAAAGPQASLEGDAAAHAVADQVRALEASSSSSSTTTFANQAAS